MTNPNDHGATLSATPQAFQIITPRGEFTATHQPKPLGAVILGMNGAAYSLTTDQARALASWLIGAATRVDIKP
jgi:hypothetical protein